VRSARTLGRAFGFVIALKISRRMTRLAYGSDEKLAMIALMILQRSIREIGCTSECGLSRFNSAQLILLNNCASRNNAISQKQFTLVHRKTIEITIRSIHNIKNRIRKYADY